VEESEDELEGMPTPETVIALSGSGPANQISLYV